MSSPMKASIGSFLLSFLILSAASSGATAFNITRLLGRYPEYSSLNDLLTKTQLNTQINRRQTITVLALDNGAISQISALPMDAMKKVLSLHVVLDYYDEEKLHNLGKKSAILTTLFQSSGSANGQQGFLNVTDLATGEIAFGSAVKGSSLDAKFVGPVAAQPYNISVIQVSTAIIPSGIDDKFVKAPLPPPPPPSPPAPAPSEEASAPEPSAAEEPSAADSPTPSPAPSADSPAADSPDAKSPVADSPASPGKAADTDDKSTATRVAGTACLTIATAVVLSMVAL